MTDMITMNIPLLLAYTMMLADNRGLAAVIATAQLRLCADAAAFSVLEGPDDTIKRMDVLWKSQHDERLFRGRFEVQVVSVVPQQGHNVSREDLARVMDEMILTEVPEFFGKLRDMFPPPK